LCATSEHVVSAFPLRTFRISSKLSGTAKLRARHPLRLDYHWHSDGDCLITWPHLHVDADIR
jgi:hypothetical protein